MIYKICIYFFILLITLDAQTFSGCSQDEVLILSGAEENLTQKLNESITVLENALEPTTGYRYFRAFGGPSIEKQQFVKKILLDMYSNIANKQMSYSCVSETEEADCSYLAAFTYSNSDTIYFCNHFVQNNPELVLGTLGHELAHVSNALHYERYKIETLEELYSYMAYTAIFDADTISGFLTNDNGYTMEEFKYSAQVIEQNTTELIVSNYQSPQMLYTFIPSKTANYTFESYLITNNLRDLTILDSEFLPIAMAKYVNPLNQSKGMTVSALLLKGKRYYLNFRDTYANEFNHNNIKISKTFNVEEFVQRFYIEILKREADNSGLEYWTNKLASGESAGSDIARGFINSDEFMEQNTTNIVFLETLYKAFFNRLPDDAGLASWLYKMDEGITRDKILDGFLYSEEFSNLCDTYKIIAVNEKNIEGFVRRFYTKILQRNPDAEGLNYWVETLQNGQNSGSDIALGFIFSDEFLGYGKAAVDFIPTLYQAFFDRKADSNGFIYWYNEVMLNGKTYKDIVNGFLNSEEFSNLCNIYGIKPVK